MRRVATFQPSAYLLPLSHTTTLMSGPEADASHTTSLTSGALSLFRIFSFTLRFSLRPIAMIDMTGKVKVPPSTLTLKKGALLAVDSML